MIMVTRQISNKDILITLIVISLTAITTIIITYLYLLSRNGFVTNDFTIAGLVEQIHNEQKKLIHLKIDIQHFMDLIDKYLTQKNNLRSSCSQTDVRMSKINYQVKEHQKNAEAMDEVHDCFGNEKLKLNDKANRLQCDELVTTLKREIEETLKVVEKNRKDFRLFQEGNTKMFDDGPEMEHTYTELIDNYTILLICIVIVPISILFCFVYYKDRQTGADVKKKTEYLIQNIGKPTLRWESFSILDKIIERDVDKLEKKYCIVSFHPETHHRHIRMVGVCVEGRHREKKYEESDFIVTSHESIPNIPYVMVTLVFIDSNKQGQILETPGQDSNDIKLLTVQACRKQSSDVFVIYVGDEESRSLMPGLLFNPKLTAVTEHFELKQLEQKDRVLTVHERFTITQREKIAEAIA